MGTANQTPNSRTRQPGANTTEHHDPKSARTGQDKGPGNVPRGEDEIGGQDNQGTREDGAGSTVRNS